MPRFGLDRVGEGRLAEMRGDPVEDGEATRGGSLADPVHASRVPRGGKVEVGRPEHRRFDRLADQAPAGGGRSPRSGVQADHGMIARPAREHRGGIRRRAVRHGDRAAWRIGHRRSVPPMGKRSRVHDGTPQFD